MRSCALYTHMFCIVGSDAPPTLRNAGFSLLEVSPRKRMQIAQASMAMNAVCCRTRDIRGGIRGRVPAIFVAGGLLSVFLRAVAAAVAVGQVTVRVDSVA